MTKAIAAFAILLTLTASADSETQADASAATESKAEAASTTEKRAGDGQPVAEARVAKDDVAQALAGEDPEKIDWSQVDWKQRLTKLQYYITREAGTERAFTGKYWNFFKPGEYRCVGCGLPLFESDAKFESDCGWPSFDRPISDKTLTEHVDHKIGYPRTEIRCRRCQAHLGHVFNDGPTETGQRYCLNSAAMKFVSVKALKSEQEKTAEKKGAPAQAVAAGKPATPDTDATAEQPQAAE